MANRKWDDLVPKGSATRSPSEIVQELTGIAGASSSSGSAFSSAGSSSPTDLINSLVQGPTQEVGEQISGLTTQMTSLASIQQTQLSATENNTQAVQQNTASKPGSGSTASTLSSIASNVVGTGSILSPIATGLIDLFGGGDSNQASPATAAFTLPAPVQYDYGIGGGSAGSISPVSYGENAQPRLQTATIPQVTIQVSTMDSQSFLDHRDEIAQAVKEALLTSNSLSDVISEL